MDDPAVRGQPNSVAVCAGTVLIGRSWAEPQCGASPMLFIVPRVQLGRDRVAVSSQRCHVLRGAGVLGAVGGRPWVGSHGESSAGEADEGVGVPRRRLVYGSWELGPGCSEIIIREKNR